MMLASASGMLVAPVRAAALAVACGAALCAHAAECDDALDPQAIQRTLGSARTDSLSSEQMVLLGCLDAGLQALNRRYPLPPSCELLREIRGRYRALGRDPALGAALTPLLASRVPGVSCAALRALVLYGDSARIVTLRDECGARGHLMHLAVAGDTTAAALAIERYRAGRAAKADEGEERTLGIRDKVRLLDVVYYLGTPAGIEFLIDVAVTDPDDVVRQRADWMLAHPCPAEP